MTGTIRLPRLVMAAVLTTTLAIGVVAPVAAEADEAVLEELIALEQHKLEPWYGSASTDVYISAIADDSTYFDPWAPSKLSGPAVIEYLKGFEGNIPHLAFELTDASVDVRGEIAIFSYQILNSDPESGEPMGSWMVTKIMNPTDDGWEVIHTHYGMPDPPPEPVAEE